MLPNQFLLGGATFLIIIIMSFGGNGCQCFQYLHNLCRKVLVRVLIGLRMEGLIDKEDVLMSIKEGAHPAAA